MAHDGQLVGIDHNLKGKERRMTAVGFDNRDGEYVMSFLRKWERELAPTTCHRKKNKPRADTSRIECSTYARESQPRSNTRNDRMHRPSSSSQHNKLEVHHRNFKFDSNKNNHVSGCNANVKRDVLNLDSENVFITCNECLFSANHDSYVVKYLNDVNKGLEPQLLTFVQISLGLVPNHAPSTSSNPQSKKDLEILFQPMFDEYFKPTPSVVSLTISVAALLQNTAKRSSSTTIDQDGPSPSTTSITHDYINPVQDINVEEQT
ncbi:hypothetical protein Tco_0592733 [Tanacetum coccineum]